MKTPKPDPATSRDSELAPDRQSAPINGKSSESPCDATPQPRASEDDSPLPGPQAESACPTTRPEGADNAGRDSDESSIESYVDEDIKHPERDLPTRQASAATPVDVSPANMDLPADKLENSDPTTTESHISEGPKQQSADQKSNDGRLDKPAEFSPDAGAEKDATETFSVPGTGRPEEPARASEGDGNHTFSHHHPLELATAMSGYIDDLFEETTHALPGKQSAMPSEGSQDSHSTFSNLNSNHVETVQAANVEMPEAERPESQANSESQTGKTREIPLQQTAAHSLEAEFSKLQAEYPEAIDYLRIAIRRLSSSYRLACFGLWGRTRGVNFSDYAVARGVLAETEKRSLREAVIHSLRGCHGRNKSVVAPPVPFSKCRLQLITIDVQPAHRTPLTATFTLGVNAVSPQESNWLRAEICSAVMLMLEYLPYGKSSNSDLQGTERAQITADNDIPNIPPAQPHDLESATPLEACSNPGVEESTLEATKDRNESPGEPRSADPQNATAVNSHSVHSTPGPSKQSPVIVGRWILGCCTRMWSQFRRLPQALQVSIACLCLGLLLAPVLPFPYQPVSPCTVIPARIETINATQEMQVLEWLVQPGERVAKGQLLARFHSQSIEERRYALAAEFAEAKVLAQQAMFAGDDSAEARTRIRMTELRTAIDEVLEQLQAFDLRSPQQGFVHTCNTSLTAGQTVGKGQELVTIVPAAKLAFQIELSSKQVGFVEQGDRGMFKTAPTSPMQLPYVIKTIAPQPTLINGEQVFLAQAEADGEGAVSTTWLRPDLSGIAETDAGWFSLARFAFGY